MQQMLSQAKQMQDTMQEKLGQTVVEGSSGGGAVTVRMTGQKHVLAVRIAPAAVTGLGANTADLEMLEDLVTAAFNDAARRADEAAQSSVSGLLGGMGLPPGLL
jgi:DNA-binding YbaB/EbfC family protein